MSTNFFQFYSLMQLFLLTAWFPYDRYDRWEKKSSAIAAIIWKPLSSDRCRCDRYNRWKVVSLWSLWSLNIFFSAIVAIIWKPGLSYASLLNKYVAITIILSKQEGCIMFFTYSCFNCRNEKRFVELCKRENKASLQD